MSEPAHPVQELVRANESAAINGTLAGDENIRQIFAPDQTVMEIAMAAVLIAAKIIRFGFVIHRLILRRAEDSRAGVNEQMDVALEVN